MISQDDTKPSVESEDELKQDLKKLQHKQIRKPQKLQREALFVVPNDPRLSFLKDKFCGVDKFTTMRAVDSNGVLYKRAVLPDETIAHAFILSSDESLRVTV